jgi:hypothetical protein
MKKQITIKDFHKLNNTFDKMKMCISFLEDKGSKSMHIDVLKEHLESACDFWVDLYKRKGK